MRKNFLVLIFLFFTFSILNAKPLKTEAELQNIRNKADKIIQEELKNDYKKEYLKRKNNLEKIEGIKENLFSDGEFVFRLEDGIVTEALKTIETIHNTTVAKIFDEEGNLLTIIFSINDENSRFYRYYDENLNLTIDVNCIDGKCIQKGYYSDKKLAYIKEGKLTENLDILTNGKYTEYYKNGQIKIQGSYKEGMRNGEFKTFLKNGKSAGSIIYKDGKIIKSTLVKAMKDNASFSPVTDIYYKLEDSHTLRKVDYENGLLKTYFIYNKDGIPDGETITYYENGNLDEEFNYKNNKMNGEAKSYDENGKLNGRTIFKDDIKLEEDVYKENEILKNTFKNGELVKQDICTLNGTLKERRILNGDELEYSTFYQNGNVKQKILAKDKIIIKEQIYARNGNIMSNSFFSDGKPVIELFEYYPNGNIKEKVHFINDKEEGEHFFYDKKGKLIKTEIYKNGIKQ